MNAALIACGALLNLVGSFAYIRDTLRGTTKPNRVTWFLWSVAPMIAFAASFTSGITWATIPVFMSGFCPFLIFVAWSVNRMSAYALAIVSFIPSFIVASPSFAAYAFPTYLVLMSGLIVCAILVRRTHATLSA